jgi:polar amino acid transport system substrate-binding protein
MKTILIAVLLCFGTLEADIITLRADEWCPYNCQPNDEKPGFMIDIAKAIFDEAGHTIDYQTIPWARAISETRSGTYNAIVGTSKTQVSDFIFPTDEQGLSSVVFWILAGENWHYTGIPSLYNISVGINLGYSYTPEMNLYISENRFDMKRIQYVAGEHPKEINLNKLLEKRIFTYLEDRLVMLYYLRKKGIESQIKEAGLLLNEPVYIAFSPNHPKSQEYAKILSDGMEKLRNNGNLQKILDLYDVKDWKLNR